MLSYPLLFNNRFKLTAISWWMIVFLMPFSAVLQAQSPGFQASVDVKDVYVGQPFELSFTLIDAEGQQFTPPGFPDFKLSGPASELRGMSFVNGKSSSKQSWTYVLEAKRPGQFTIGAASVFVNGKRLNSNELKIKVLDASKALKAAPVVPPGQNDDVFIVGILGKASAFPGEQVSWSLKLYTKVGIEGADLISLPSFEDFYSKEKRRFDTRVQYQNIKGNKYAVKTLHEESIFPQKTGELIIGAAKIRVGIEPPGTQGFLYGPKLVTLSSQPVRLTVKQLPEPSPETFTGGVGHYEWEVTADSNALTTDDALTITVTLKGNGDSRRFAAPKIQVPNSFEIFDPRILQEEEYENMEEVVHSKSLEYVVLPKEPGTQVILPAMTYFDVDSNKYTTVYAAPISINVTAGKNYQHPDSIQVPAPITEFTRSQDGFLDKLKTFFGSPIFIVGLLLLMLSFIAFLILGKRKKREPRPDPVVKAAAPINPKLRLSAVKQLLPNATPGHFYNELLKALQTYCATRLQLSANQLDQGVLQAKLKERQVPPIRIQALLSIIQTCEQAVYAGQSEAANMASDLEVAEQVIQALEKELS